MNVPKVAPAELIESPDAIQAKAEALADEIRKSKHMIVFTGAGVSTSAGIPDFRGPEGSWTLRAQGRQRTGKAFSPLTAIPTPTHMALVELQNRGILKYLISQNCDGLHRRSGILPDKISELHGNSNREYCRDCDKEYIRDFRAVATYEKTVTDHRTGRKCAICSGVLLDTIINFGEALPEEALATARKHARKSDLCIALGSSLTVTPACDIPKITAANRKGKLAICNLQTTPIDHLAAEGLRVHGKTDELMIAVMSILGFPIPKFVLRRRFVVEVVSKSPTQHHITVGGIDVDGTPVTFLQSVRLEDNRRVAKQEPYVIQIREEIEVGRVMRLELEFMGHYGEPNLWVEWAFEGDMRRVWGLEYDPSTGAWKVMVENGEGQGQREEDALMSEVEASLEKVAVDDGEGARRAARGKPLSARGTRDMPIVLG